MAILMDQDNYSAHECVLFNGPATLLLVDGQLVPTQRELPEGLYILARLSPAEIGLPAGATCTVREQGRE